MTVIVISFWKRNSKDLNGVLKRRKIMDNFFNLSDTQKKKKFLFVTCDCTGRPL
jgi:hypothetical protein